MESYGSAECPTRCQAVDGARIEQPAPGLHPFLDRVALSGDEFIESPHSGHASGAIRRYKGDAYVLGDKTMDMGITIAAQLAIFAAVCVGPVLAFGIKLMPARAPAGYVRRQLGER